MINTDQRTFLVSFQYKTSNKKFIFQTAKELKEILEKHDNGGIETIKEFCPKTNTFKVLKRQSLLDNFSFQTEEHLYFKKHYYFKKCV